MAYLLLWLGSILTTIANCTLQGASCYTDDGTMIDGDFPCNPDAQQSFCCGKYWTCLEGGVCSDQNTTQFIGLDQTFYARGTCTDQTYSDSVCPQFCLGDLGRGIVFSETNSSFCCHQDLNLPCSADPSVKSLDLGTPLTTIGLPTGTSASVSTTSAAATSTFSLAKASEPGSQAAQTSQTAAKPSTSPGEAAATTASSTSSGEEAAAAKTSLKSSPSVASAASSTLSPSSSGLSEGAKIGVAVGVTIVAVSVIAALLFFWYRRRQRQKLTTTGETKPELSAEAAVKEKGHYAPVPKGEPQEMDGSSGNHTIATRGELAAESQNPRAEMSDMAGQELAGSQRRPSELPGT